MTTYLITGATGMIGGLVLQKLVFSDEYIFGNVRIIAIVRNISKFNEIYRGEIYKNVIPVEQDICEPIDIDEEVDYIIHCAATTRSAYMISNPVEVADGIMVGTKNVLEFAKNKNIKSMVYLSSMEVYGVVNDDNRKKEDELGFLSLTEARSCYPLAKRMAEHYCNIYFKEYGVPVKVARLAQTFGDGVRIDDNRVYMQFAKAIVNNTDIVLKTDGKSVGNYCDSYDVINAIFLLLDKGENGEIYNVVNENNTMSILEMAELVVKHFANEKIKVIVSPENRGGTGYAPNTALRLSSEKIEKIGWKPQKDIISMYENIIAILRKK